MEIKRIIPEQTKELLDSNAGYIYLDVRTVPEFDAGHVPGFVSPITVRKYR
ncbi:MAG TPA: rhodanese-like domain-containing protein [Candidatus Dormibacteraeota bacterium]|nr:rhodanese-like domain-containing protein [Candidatus Dormibacteraeota bacterium]